MPGQNSSTAAQPKTTGRAEEPGTTHEAHNAVKREPDLPGVPVDGTARAPISLSDDDSPPRKKSSASGQKAKDPSAPSARPPIASPSLKRIAPTEPVRSTASRSANPGPGANEDALGEEAKREWEDYRLAARKLALEERRIALERKFGREPDDVTGK